MSLDVVFRSLGSSLLDCNTSPDLEASIGASDASEAAVYSAQAFLETVYADIPAASRQGSRAPTPMIVRSSSVISRLFTRGCSLSPSKTASANLTRLDVPA